MISKIDFVKRYAWKFKQRTHICVDTAFVVGLPASITFCSPPGRCTKEDERKLYVQVVEYLNANVDFERDTRIYLPLTQIDWSPNKITVNRKKWLDLTKVTEEQARKNAIWKEKPITPY